MTHTEFQNRFIDLWRERSVSMSSSTNPVAAKKFLKRKRKACAKALCRTRKDFWDEWGDDFPAYFEMVKSRWKI